MLILRLIHIVAGGFWAGAGVLMGWVIAPAARSAGPGAAPFMQALLRRKVTLVLITAGLITIASGIGLWSMRPPTMSRWQDWALVVGALSGTGALAIGIGLQRPTSKKMQALGAEITAGGTPPSQAQGAEMARLQGNMAKYGSVLSYLFVIALSGMALGGS